MTGSRLNRRQTKSIFPIVDVWTNARQVFSNFSL